MKTFKYFRDPANFAFVSEVEEECSVCGNSEICFDALSYLGDNEIEFICDQCLADGKLMEMGVTANEVALAARPDSPEAEKEINTIIYRTPKLPTWQDCVWPCVDGVYPVFVKIASKPDFDNDIEALKTSVIDDYDLGNLDDVWHAMPNHRISSLNDCNYGLSVYLFDANGKQVSFWDCS